MERKTVYVPIFISPVVPNLKPWFFFLENLPKKNFSTLPASPKSHPLLRLRFSRKRRFWSIILYFNHPLLCRSVLQFSRTFFCQPFSHSLLRFDERREWFYGARVRQRWAFERGGWGGEGAGVELVVSCTARKKVLISILIRERGGERAKRERRPRWSKMKGAAKGGWGRTLCELWLRLIWGLSLTGPKYPVITIRTCSIYVYACLCTSMDMRMGVRGLSGHKLCSPEFSATHVVVERGLR